MLVGDLPSTSCAYCRHVASSSSYGTTAFTHAHVEGFPAL